jgi:Zn-dependent peptidase ImmA (M78 family)/transcriptional regulator with XRE-family HTH domain
LGVAKKVPALVEGEVLAWARESAGYSVQDIAARFKKEPDEILAWERNEAHPYMGQLRDLANLYKRPISDFYLPTPPDERPLPHDFRRSPGEVAGRYSPALRKQLRFARERQDLSRYLQAGVGEPLLLFEHRVSQKQSPEEVGGFIRDLLGVTFGEQRRWRDPYGALNAWRRRIEGLGVLVFQFENVEIAEALGFSIVERVFPVIGINKALPPNGRTFTMLHELVHLLLGEGGICDIDDFTPRDPRELAVEVFCNHSAAAALMPEESFRSDPIVRSRSSPATDWSDDEIREIAATFSVSREAVVRRLLTFNLTTSEFYREQRAAYQAQREAQKAREREKNKNREFAGQNRAQRAVSDLGGNFVRLVLSSYGEERITLADAAEYLEVGPPSVRKVQELTWRG